MTICPYCGYNFNCQDLGDLKKAFEERNQCRFAGTNIFCFNPKCKKTLWLNEELQVEMPYAALILQTPR